MSEFVENYISDCIDHGICTPKDMCDHALNRIDDIDEELMRHHQLRKEKNDLQLVLRTFGHESFKKPRRGHTPMINPEVAEAELDPSYAHLLSSICDFIDQSARPVMPREIMDKMLHDNAIEHGNVEDKQRCIYMSIKRLLDQGIISRNDEDRSISPGNNWNEKP